MLPLASKALTLTNSPVGNLLHSNILGSPTPLKSLANEVKDNLIDKLANAILQQLLGGNQNQQSGPGSFGGGNNVNGPGGFGGSNGLNGLGNFDGANGPNGLGNAQGGAGPFQSGNLLDQLISQVLSQLIGDSLMKQLQQGLTDPQNQNAFNQGATQGLGSPQPGGQSMPGSFNSPTDFTQAGNAVGNAVGNAMGNQALQNAGATMDALREVNPADAKGKSYHTFDRGDMPAATEVCKFMDAHPEIFGKSDQANFEKDIKDGRLNDNVIDKFMQAKNMLQDAISGTPNPAFQDPSVLRDAQSFAGQIGKNAVENPPVVAPDVPADKHFLLAQA